MKNKTSPTCSICNKRLQSRLGKSICRSCLRIERLKNIPPVFCRACNKEILPSFLGSHQDRKACSLECSFLLRKGRKHSDETKRKIAVGNSKPCEPEKARKISESNKFKIPEETLRKLKYFWDLGYVSDKEIEEKTGLRARVYQRAKKEYCKSPGPIKFLPWDLKQVETEKIIQLAKDGVHFKDIAQFVGRGEKQTIGILKKLGLDYCRQRPRISGFGSEPKTEKYVREWLSSRGIEFKQWYYLSNNSKWEYDFWIKGTNILLEVNGDYWHCNPQIYKNGPINEWQKTSQRRDYLKRKYAKDCGYRLIYVWEKSIRENDKDFLNKIEEQIKNELNAK